MKMFLLYDVRARTTGDTDKAEVMDTAESEDEAREAGKLHPADSLWYEYECMGNELVGGTPRFDLDLVPGKVAG